MKRADALRYLGALATLVVGIVHLQQYADSLSAVPTIGVLFLLNGAGAGLVAVMLATRRARLGAIGAIALSAGALVSIAISMTETGLFAYVEPAFRPAVTIAVVAEIIAMLLLAAYLAVGRRRRAPVRVDWSAPAPQR